MRLSGLLSVDQIVPEHPYVSAETLDVLTYTLQEMVPELATLNKVEVSRAVSFTLRSVRRATAFG